MGQQCCISCAKITPSDEAQFQHKKGAQADEARFQHKKGAFSKCYCLKRIPEQNLPKTQSHYVYIMTNTLYPRDYIKIGRTINLPRRVNELNGQMLTDHILPIYYIEVENDKELEHYLHQQFAPYRISKHREWFQVNPHTVIKTILQYANGQECTNKQEHTNKQ